MIDPSSASSFLEETVRQLNAAIQFRVDAAINYATQIELQLDLVDNCSNDVQNLFHHIFANDTLRMMAENNHGFKRVTLSSSSSSQSSTDTTQIILQLNHWQSFDPSEFSSSDFIYLPPSSHTPQQQQTSPIQPPLIDMMEATVRYAQAADSVNELDDTIARLQLEIASMVESERRKEDQLTHIYNSQVRCFLLLLLLYDHDMNVFCHCLLTHILTSTSLL